jgi:hypothetical protein
MPWHPHEATVRHCHIFPGIGIRHCQLVAESEPQRRPEMGTSGADTAVVAGRINCQLFSEYRKSRILPTSSGSDSRSVDATRSVRHHHSSADKRHYVNSPPPFRLMMNQLLLRARQVHPPGPMVSPATRTALAVVRLQSTRIASQQRVMAGEPVRPVRLARQLREPGARAGR